MKQQIRLNTFETNSSSVHSLVIEKSHYDYLNDTDPLYDNDRESVESYNSEIQLDKHWNIRIMGNPYHMLDDPQHILSYLYSLSLFTHFNLLEDKLRKLFPNCVFEKPLWNLPLDEKIDYCDDRSITNFCDCVQLDEREFPYATFTYDDLYQITDYCLSIIFHGYVTVFRDENFESSMERNNKTLKLPELDKQDTDVHEIFCKYFTLIAEA